MSETAEDHFERYLAAYKKGLRAEAQTAAKAFSASLETVEEKWRWLQRNFNRLPVQGNRALQHHIYWDVVYPTLIHYKLSANAWAIFLLAKTATNWGSRPDVIDRDHLPSPLALYKEAHELDPEEPIFAQALLKALLCGFDYCDHEWPSGLLLERNRDWQDEIAEITTDIALARRLDQDGGHRARLAEFEARVKEYSERLARAQRSPHAH